MFDLHDVVLSTRDAAALSALVTDWLARDASARAGCTTVTVRRLPAGSSS